MAKLMNTKWERFAQSVAAGRTAAQAYAEAGFSPSASNASRLENTPEVQARIAELTEAARAERVKIDKDRLTEMLLADRQAASEAGKLSTALAATIALGKLHGASFNPLNPDHLEKVMPEPEKLGATPDVDFKAMVAKFGACK